jgi:protein angel
MDSLGFFSLYKKRGRDKNDGCALFYDRKTFVLEDSVRLEFNQDNVRDDQKRDNVAIIARFKTREESSGRRLVVATTHLLYNPKRGDIKLTQLRILLAEVKRLAARPTNSSEDKYHSIILAGDFNSQPQSPLVDFILNGSIDPVGKGRGELSGQGNDSGRIMQPLDLLIQNVDLNCTLSPSKESKGSCLNGESGSSMEADCVQSQVSHDFNFESVWPSVNPTTGLPFISTRIQECASLVDYVFFMSSVKLVCLSYQALPTQEEVASTLWQPNEGMPSDHFPLQAMFLLTK